MSIRIDNDQMTGSGCLQHLPNEQNRLRVSPRVARNPVARTSVQGEDQVDVSSATTSSIGAAVSSSNAARSSRVQQLGALYAGGQYRVDSVKTSARSLVSGVERSTPRAGETGHDARGERAAAHSSTSSHARVSLAGSGAMGGFRSCAGRGVPRHCALLESRSGNCVDVEQGPPAAIQWIPTLGTGGALRQRPQRRESPRQRFAPAC